MSGAANQGSPQYEQRQHRQKGESANQADTIVRAIMGLTPSLLSRGQIHLAVAEGCRRSLEISIPVPEVESETSRVMADAQKRAKLPGFRPGKAPVLA